MPTVLVVTDRRSIQDPVGEALEERGFDVLQCPGPQRPTYECAGGRMGHCALADATEAVVLDCDLASDAALEGTPSWHLLWYYRNLGIPVVALADANDLPGSIGDDEVLVLPRYTPAPSVVAAVKGLLRRRMEAIP